MITIKCDACMKTLGSFEVRNFDAPEHLLGISHLAGSYVNSEGEFTNRKTRQKDLCVKCYNQVMNAAVNQISIIRRGALND